MFHQTYAESQRAGDERDSRLASLRGLRGNPTIWPHLSCRDERAEIPPPENLRMAEFKLCLVR
jgi:hypothetical protein